MMTKQHCRMPECRHGAAHQWWDREPGWWRRDELPRALARPALYDVRTLPCAGVAHDDKQVANACYAQRHVGWWERLPRRALAELTYQSKRLAGQPAFALDD
jgi:hypothetical protein